MFVIELKQELQSFALLAAALKTVFRLPFSFRPLCPGFNRQAVKQVNWKNHSRGVKEGTNFDVPPLSWGRKDLVDFTYSKEYHDYFWKKENLKVVERHSS